MSRNALAYNTLAHIYCRFQWASCQLAYLRHCPWKRIQRTLDNLPETLDGIYRHTLRDIDKSDRALAHCLFNCVSVARRPLRVEELAELLTLNLKAGPFRLFRRGCRQEDLLNAVQTKYSSLFAITKDGDTTIIQFSHFSVQEFFENAILTGTCADVSYYHVPMAPTHTLVAQACLDVLLFFFFESILVRLGYRTLCSTLQTNNLRLHKSKLLSSNKDVVNLSLQRVAETMCQKMSGWVMSV